MKTGLILIGSAFVLFFVLSFINIIRRKDWFEFEPDYLSSLHTSVWFWGELKQFLFRTALALSFCLYAAGVIVFALNCFPEWGMTWDKVCIRLFAAFIGGYIGGYILVVVANILSYGIPIIGITILYLIWKPIDWLRGGD